MLTLEALHQSVVQLEEVKRLILAGDVPRLRLALILGDNVIELLLRRAAENRLRSADTYYRMLRTFPEGSLDEKDEALRQPIGAKALHPKKQDQIRQFFPAKVKYLLTEHKAISASQARVIEHLHRYRNELQHRDHVRKESIRPATLVLFDVGCDLLSQLEFGGFMHPSNHDQSWLADYGITVDEVSSHREPLVRALRGGVQFETKALLEELAEALQMRLTAMEGMLDFIVGAKSRLGNDVATVIKALQFHEAHQHLPPLTGGAAFDAFRPRYAVGAFQRWRQGVTAMSRETEKIKAFERFAILEADMETLERLIEDATDSISAAVEMKSTDFVESRAPSSGEAVPSAGADSSLLRAEKCLELIVWQALDRCDNSLQRHT